jgi:histidinol-phosphate aminotransferase
VATTTRDEQPRLREALRGIPAYQPGLRSGGGEAAGDRPRFTLSWNENPYPPLPGVLAAAVAAAGEANRYPDMSCAGLIAELATTLEVPPTHLATGAGSVGVAQQLLQATSGPGDEVVLPWRSFEAYPIAIQVSGARAVPVPLRADDSHDLAAMAAAVNDRTRLVFLCSPNNPTGNVLHRDEVADFLDRVPRDVLVVLDEAYLEFVRDPDAVNGIEIYRDRPNVAVLRTFSKAHGLAGLRIGYAIAHEPVATALRQTAVPFGVSQLAQNAAIASLRARSALLERVATLVAERERVLAALAAQGWTSVTRSEANFVWLRLGERAAEFARACLAAGVVVRPFDGEGVRVSVAEPAANDIFLAVAARFARSTETLPSQRNTAAG